MAEDQLNEQEDRTLTERIKKAAEDAAEAVKETAETVVEKAQVAVEEAAEKAEDFVEKAKVAVEEAAEKAKDAVEEAAEKAEDAAETMVEKAKDSVKEAAEKTKDAVEKATEAVAKTAKKARARIGGEAEASAPEASTPETRGGDGEAYEAPSLKGYTGRESHETVKLEDLGARELTPSEQSKRTRLEDLMNASFSDIPEQDIVMGRVVTVSDKDVVIDIGGKSDGIVARNQFGVDLVPGQEVEVFVERLENRQGQLQLSKEKADATLRWRRIQRAFETEEVLEGEIIRRIKGGMIVMILDDTEAFLPGSQIDVRPVRDFDAYLGRRMEFKIVKLNETNQNIVVSHKILIEADLAEQRQSILDTMEPGQVLEGTVKNITDFGVFVDLGGVDGLLHITDLSWGRVHHPSEVVEPEQKLNVVVLDYDRDRQRISLGLKQLQGHPWDGIHDRYTEGQEVEGKVVSITDYGAFVELEKGIEGLVHISEMSWTEHVKHPSQVVKEGDKVIVKILGIDDDAKKISLGMKQLQPDPWDGIAERYPNGHTFTGKVRNITAFGVFVEIEPGIDGLVHISDLSWTKKVRHPGEVVKKGQDLDVVVLGIDEKNRRISLGHKQVADNPWEDFRVAYGEGVKTPATVVRVHDKGIDVELPAGVEAFVPAGELKKPGHPADGYREGEQLDELVVIRFDGQNKEIILSETAEAKMAQRSEREQARAAKAAERAQEAAAMASYQKQQQSSGGTTLGELSGLAALRDKFNENEG